jgi:hypothetical protein
VNGLTNESENALPLDESFWEHMAHEGLTVGIPVSSNKTMDVLAVLEDIYYTINDDPMEAQRLIIMMAALLVASKDGQADFLWQEFTVEAAMQDLDHTLKDILNEES